MGISNHRINHFAASMPPARRNALAFPLGEDGIPTTVSNLCGSASPCEETNPVSTNPCAYDAWGNVLSEVCTVPALATIRYRFQGREWSAVTGLINFRMRWYDPETGRWLSKDPIGLGGGLNLYAFGENNPIEYMDPKGTMSFNDFLELLGAAASGFAEGFAKGLAADIDGFLPLVDPFSFYYTDDCGNYEDPMYENSYWTGILTFEAMITVAGEEAFATLRAGKEIKLGKNLRIALNGNRTGNKFGERPHYHRRVTNPNGSTRPGQGIGRHRPWETKSSDKSFWDRF